MTADDWIRHLGLVPHPEGGYFRETYRAAESIPAPALPPRFSGPRRFSTAIYFLLRGEQRSRLHRIRSDELWHFLAGGPLTLVVLEPSGRLTTVTMGSEPERGEQFQAAVPAECWFGAYLEGAASFALVSCTVAPGFEFEDFELADPATLLRRYPQHQSLIARVTD